MQLVLIAIGRNGSRSGEIPFEISPAEQISVDTVICTLLSICISRWNPGESVTKQCTIQQR